MQVRDDASHETRLLEGQVRGQCRSRRGRQERADQGWLAGGYGVGVRVEKKSLNGGDWLKALFMASFGIQTYRA